jgi:hypothetical protein
MGNRTYIQLHFSICRKGVHQAVVVMRKAGEALDAN